MPNQDWLDDQVTIERVGAWLRETLHIVPEFACGGCGKTFDEHGGVDFNGRQTGIVGPLFACLDFDAPDYEPGQLFTMAPRRAKEASRGD